MKHITGDVFLPANVTCLQVVHTPVCGLFGNEARRVGFQGRLPIFRAPPTAFASLPEGSV